MNYLKIDKCSVTNGIGVRVVLWCSGCTMNCKGCHNPQSHDFNNGTPFTEETMREIFDLLDKPYVSGLTLSGGHPLEVLNLSTVYNIVKRVREKYPNKSIWIYSGLTFEQIKKIDNSYKEREIKCPSPFDIVKMCDVLVDGRYIDELRDISLAFRGSNNQRIIDIPKTFEKGDIILWNNQENN